MVKFSWLFRDTVRAIKEAILPGEPVTSSIAANTNLVIQSMKYRHNIKVKSLQPFRVWVDLDLRM